MSSPESTPDAILHLATLHLLSQAGFASTSKAASLTLSSVVAQYFKTVSRACIDRANLAGRNKPGAYDVVESLKELGYGFGLDELYEYGLDSSCFDVFQGEPLDKLSDYLEEGRTIYEPVAQLRLIPNDELEEDADEENAAGGADDDSDAGFVKMDVKEEQMDVDVDEEESQKMNPGASAAHRIRFQSPDFSWLPPLPDTSSVISTRQPTGYDSGATDVKVEYTASKSQSAPSSIAERYRTRIPYTSSSLSAQTIHTIPTPLVTRRIVTTTAASTSTPPTNLANLIQTYTDTRGEMSVAIRPNGFRLQALDLLRRQVTAPDDFGPSESLSGTDVVPGPKSTPIVVPLHPVSVNPDQSGILTQLVHSIHSGNLPPELRERLTSLRPPLPQKRDGVPLFYGPAIRGADTAALLKHQGKQPEEADEVYAQATWDVGPRGEERFSRGSLPRGKKVIKSVEGEDAPRQEKRKSVDTSTTTGTGGAGTGSGSGAGRTTLRLKLGDSLSPVPPSPASASTPAVGTGGGNLPTPPLATPGGTTIRLRFPGSQEPPKLTSPSPATAPPQGSTLLSDSSSIPLSNGPDGPAPRADAGVSNPGPSPNPAVPPSTLEEGITPGSVVPPPHRSIRLSVSPHVNSIPLPPFPSGNISDKNSSSPSTRTLAGQGENQAMDIDQDRKPSLAASEPSSEVKPHSATPDEISQEAVSVISAKQEPV